MSKYCIFADLLLVVSYALGVLLTLFLHNKVLLYIGIEEMKPLHDMLLSLHTRSSREVYWKETKLRSLDVTENKA